MDKEARDVSTCIATAARKLGYYAENVSDYVDDPDRTNCLVRRYARFADEPILDRFVYENPHPDWVVLIEETIIKAVNFFHRTHPAQGVLVINSARDPQYLLKFLPETMLAKLDKLVVVDATGLAEQRGSSPWMFVRDLSELAFDRMSTEGAVERLAIGRGIAAPMIGALVAATGELPVDAVAEVVADRDAMLRGAEKHTVVQYAEVILCPCVAHTFRNTCGCPSRVSRRRPRRKTASGCSRPATSASTGRCTGTRRRPATTPAPPVSRSRSTWITSSTTVTWTATSPSWKTTRCRRSPGGSAITHARPPATAPRTTSPSASAGWSGSSATTA
jgi:Pyruvate/2-oxoacid:ferredoxin oxidoreductase gamma subunit